MARSLGIAQPTAFRLDVHEHHGDGSAVGAVGVGLGL